MKRIRGACLVLMMIGAVASIAGCAVIGAAATATTFIVSTTADVAIGVGRVATTVVGTGLDALTLSAPRAVATSGVPAPALKK